MLFRSRAHGQFAAGEEKARDKYYKYWVGGMAGKFADWDEFQIDLADFQRVYENDTGKWIGRLDDQFRKFQKPDDNGRIVRWIALFREQPKKVTEYYGKIDFPKMSNRQVRELLEVAYEQVKDASMAKSVFGRFQLEKLTDGERAELARYQIGRAHV